MAALPFAVRRLDLTSPRTAGNLALTVTVLAWAAYYPMVEVLVRDWDALSLSASRVLVAAALLLGLLYRQEGLGAFRNVEWGKLVLIGTFGFAAFMTLTPVGIALSSGASAALVTAANPGLAALFARVVYAEPIQRDNALAVVVSLVGGAIVVFGSGESLAVPGLGELAVLVANIAWIWASIVSQRWFTGSSQLRITALAAASGAVVLSVLWAMAWVTGLIDLRIGSTATSLGLMVATAVASNAVGYLLWNLGVNRLGISGASLYANMVPVVAVGIALAMGGTVSSLQLLGGAVIVLGVIAANLGTGLPRKLPAQRLAHRPDKA